MQATLSHAWKKNVFSNSWSLYCETIKLSRKHSQAVLEAVQDWGPGIVSWQCQEFNLVHSQTTGNKKKTGSLWKWSLLMRRGGILLTEETYYLQSDRTQKTALNPAPCSLRESNYCKVAVLFHKQSFSLPLVFYLLKTHHPLSTGNQHHCSTFSSKGETCTATNPYRPGRLVHGCITATWPREQNTGLKS